MHDNFIQKILVAINFVHFNLNMMARMPIAMDVDAPSLLSKRFIS